jgi:simple sugar transport system permease protein
VLVVDSYDILLYLAFASITYMTPVLLASLGEIIAERSGVVNIGVEGVLLASAFTATLVAIVTGNPLLGFASGALVGLLAGLIHGVLAVYLRADQIIAGLAFNMVAYGLTVMGLVSIWKHHGASPRVGVSLEEIDVAGYHVNPVSLASIALAILAWYTLTKTRVGLALRACGEDPRAAEAMGVDVSRYRVAATSIGGLLAGIGGAFLALEVVGQFTRGISAGRGFIALANVAFSGWNPLLAVPGAYIFGFLEALSIYLQQWALGYEYIARTLPYIGTLLVVTAFAWKAIAPRSLAKPYVKE